MTDGNGAAETPRLPGEQPTTLLLMFPTAQSAQWSRFATSLEPEQLAIAARLLVSLSEIAMMQKLTPMLEQRVLPAATVPPLAHR